MSPFPAPSLGNVANKHCPVCRSAQVRQKWEYATSYYCCERCGHVWAR